MDVVVSLNRCSPQNFPRPRYCLCSRKVCFNCCLEMTSCWHCTISGRRLNKPGLAKLQILETNSEQDKLNEDIKVGDVIFIFLSNRVHLV